MPAPPPPRPHYQSSANEWNQGHDAPPSQSGPTLTGAEQGNLNPPAVPSASAGGSGKTVVNTPSLDTFASNMGALVAPVKDAYAKLQALPAVAPGQFYHAFVIQNKVTGSQTAAGATSNGDLVSSYKAVLKDLADGLTDLQNAATQMSQKYTSFDDLNKMKVSELQSDLDSASSEFTKSVNANGAGSSASGGAGSGGGASSGPGGGSGPKGSGSGKTGKSGKLQVTRQS
jgi:uncharacterized membrane protein YgcG